MQAGGLMDKKIDITNMVSQDNNEQKEINYWRSFRELHNDPDFLLLIVIL